MASTGQEATRQDARDSAATSVDALTEHALWLTDHRKTASEDAFIERLMLLIVESAGVLQRTRRTTRPDVRRAFLLEYATLRGKWGAFAGLLKKYDVRVGTARKWISDAGLTRNG